MHALLPWAIRAPVVASEASEGREGGLPALLPFLGCSASWPISGRAWHGAGQRVAPPPVGCQHLPWCPAACCKSRLRASAAAQREGGVLGSARRSISGAAGRPLGRLSGERKTLVCQDSGSPSFLLTTAIRILTSGSFVGSLQRE
ncbi:unnamed protein product, partial [Prorocentrum cordatum]